MNEAFARFARVIADQCGRAHTFGVVCGAILVWLASGPFFGWSDTWQLYANTVTTIITTLMVFVLQHTQNRDTIAVQLKLDEIIRAGEGRNQMRGIEDLTESQLHALRDKQRD